MRRFIRKFFPESLLEFFRLYIFGSYSLKSYSQEGEDMILRRIFEGKKTGFYVDVGAHHPKRFSNTYGFYRDGWSGVNIDAMPGSMRLFEKVRPRDVNIESPVGLGSDELTYYMFNDPALNGFDSSLSKERHAASDEFKIVNEVSLQVKTLESILDESVPKGVEIDFLTVDVEGLDLDVLKSNNWDLYHPAIVLVEVLDSSLYALKDHEITMFLCDKGYRVYAKAVNTVIFKSL